MSKFLFWMAFAIVTVGAFFHTYSVFAMSDPRWLAALVAVGVDCLMAYCLYTLGKRTGNQKTASVVGIVALALVSLTAQVVQRFNGLAVGLLPWMKWVSLFLVPASTTGGILLLGLIHYFDEGREPVKVHGMPARRPEVAAPPREIVEVPNGRENFPTRPRS